MPKLVAIVAAVASLTPGLTSAQGGYDTDPTREQWVEQADAICKRPYKRATDELDRVGPLTKRGRYRTAGRIFIRTARTIFDVNERVAALARPPADSDEIAEYLRFERRGAEISIEIGRAVKQAKVRKANRLIDRANRAFDQSKAAVRGFGLKHCV